MKTGLHAQRGISLISLVVFGVIAVFLAAGAAKIVPAYLDNQTVQAEFKALVSNPDVKTASDHEIRVEYTKQEAVSSNLGVIKDTDIDISRDGGVVTLSASYERKVPLFGNATLLLQFSPSATSR
jgi:hypothetical protein